MLYKIFKKWFDRREKAIIIAANVPATGYTALLKIANENNLPPLPYYFCDSWGINGYSKS